MVKRFLQKLFTKSADIEAGRNFMGKVNISDIDHSGQFLDRLYKAKKSKNKNVSLQFICNKTGISSTGYLSDIFKGKRVLHQKYFSNMVDFFELDRPHKKLLELLLARDKCKKNFLIIAYDKQIEVIKNSIDFKLISKGKNDDNWFSLCRVYGALAVTDPNSTLENICSFLEDMTKEKIKDSLNRLIEKGMVQEKNSKYIGTEKHLVLETTDESLEQRKEFIKDCFNKSLLEIDHIKNPRSFFNMSHVVGVKNSDCEELFRKLHNYNMDQILEAEAGSDDADNLIYFNMVITSQKKIK